MEPSLVIEFDEMEFVFFVEDLWRYVLTVTRCCAIHVRGTAESIRGSVDQMRSVSIVRNTGDKGAGNK
jgi:hypothetical protein